MFGSMSKKGNDQVKRKVKVQQFDPHKVSPTVLARQSNVPEVKTSSRRAFFDPKSSHVQVDAAQLPSPRWPPRPIRRKDIESKPWYLWTFEEATEYYMGDQLREERFGSYNKSFVTRSNQNTGATANRLAFGTKVSNVSNAITAKNLKTSAAMSSSVSSRPKTTNKNSDDGTSVVTSQTSRTVTVQRHYDEVGAEIRQRRLKVTDLMREIEEVKQQRGNLEAAAEKEYAEVQQAIEAAEQSDEALKKVEVQALQVIAGARSGVVSILQERRSQQEELHELMNKQRQQLRKGSLSLAGTGSSRRLSLASSSTPSSPEFSPLKIHERNIGSFVQKLDAEVRRNEVRAAVQRGLRRLAAAQKMKKNRSQQASATKKSVRISSNST